MKINTQNTSDIFPIFDKRDGKDCEHLQFKTWSEMGLPWNSYCERSMSGFSKFHSHEVALNCLVHSARKEKKTIIAASLSNYAVSIAVRS